MTDDRSFFERLSREPDLDAPELQAYDAADRLLIDTAAEILGGEAAIPAGAGSVPGIKGYQDRVAVIGDRHGALTLGAAQLLGLTGLRVFQDPVLHERALDRNAAALGLTETYARHPLGETLLAGARLVLMQLPRSLAELEEIADAIARFADPGVLVLAGGRDKHMSRGMNDVLARSFAEVSAGLGRGKARVLTARSPLPLERLGAPPFPVWGRDPSLPFELAAFGATFGGPTLDRGSRLLLDGLGDAAPGAQRILDLGCGNGVLAVSAALARADARVIASDQSAAAAAATRLTADAAGVADRVEVHRADATEAVPDAWAQLVLLNPPFHTGAIVHAGVAHRLIEAAARVLAPGGELRLVFNSHLRYRPLVERVIGPSRQVARDSTFTVLSAIRRPRND